MLPRLSFLVLAGCLLGALPARPATLNVEGQMNRPLRYQPEGTDFVITNGTEFFNRPLYGSHTGFRVDGGDRPEFSLFLPGRGGNLRVGFRTGEGARWLHEAEQMVTRYRPGSLLYEITDPRLGAATVYLTLLALPDTEGIIVKVEQANATAPLDLIWAYGGVNGDRGSRDGDIGTESQPVSRFFQFRSEFARNNTITLSDNVFELHSQPATIVGLASPGAKMQIADATKWPALPALMASAGQPAALPVVFGQAQLTPDQPFYLALQRLPQRDDDRGELDIYKEVHPEPAGLASANTVDGAPAATPAFSVQNLPQIFAEAEARRRALAEQVVADTPDAFINAATAAIAVAADAIWDESGTVMHGAVAWRSKLLGWRGPYANDAFGWHDRATQDFLYWAGRQNTSPIPLGLPPADAASKLSRNEAALHSNGDLSNSHYDMNLVYIDAVFRHILWTGDLDFARQMWPVIERHLAWERRLFRRPFRTDNLPLYEAYAAIWASDDLGYNGGGVTHASAYNYFHNLMAGQVARALGVDPTPYEAEADLILRAMRRELWLPAQGWYAEYRDVLGLQFAHPSPGLWTFYHTVDSAATTPLEAWQMSHFVDTQIAHIPVQGPGVPDEGYFTLPTTNWMPYTWSVNNVVMAEAAHTALAFWQAGRPDPAFHLFKGCLLDSMYLGLCPGNAGMTTAYDMARGESQRDFGDAIGMVSRTLVEGLFGVSPNLLAHEVLLRPGFPAEWDHASLRHPDFNFSFQRGELTDVHSTQQNVRQPASSRTLPVVQQKEYVDHLTPETYVFESKFPQPVGLRLQIPALLDEIGSVTVNGVSYLWHPVENSVEIPRIEILCPPAVRTEVVIQWRGAPLAPAPAPGIVPIDGELRAQIAPARLLQVADYQGVLNNLNAGADSFRAVAIGPAGPHAVFAQVQQGSMLWWMPIPFEARPAYEIIPAPDQDADHLRFLVRNNTPEAFDGPAKIIAGGQANPAQLSVPARGDSAVLAVGPAGLVPGLNPVGVDFGANRYAVSTVANWAIPADPAKINYDTVDLAGVFNDEVTQIFQHQYLSPRPLFASLTMPTNGLGAWSNLNVTATLDDKGLRELAGAAGKFTLLDGLPFATPGPGQKPNIAFVSQWDNFPREITVPLTGRARHGYFLMAGSTNSMQSRLDNAEVIITYTDGTTQRLALENPTNWWPIEQDFYLDDYAFRRSGPIPPRLNLQSGELRLLDVNTFKGGGGKIRGGAANLLDLPLDPAKELQSLTVRALANEVVVGLMAVTLAR